MDFFLNKMENIGPNHLPQNTDIIQPYTESIGYMGISRLLLTKPTIAVISGYCVAGGLELACWCDMRIADESAKFGVFCRRFGVPLIDGGNVRLPQLIGLSHAMDLILTGKEINASEAYRIGLITRLPSLTRQDAKNEAINIAKLICSYPENCMKLDRMNVYKSYGLDLLNAIKNESVRTFNNRILNNETFSAGPKQFLKGIGKHGSFDHFENSKL